MKYIINLASFSTSLNLQEVLFILCVVTITVIIFRINNHLKCQERDITGDEALFKANYMALVETVAHELKTPLTVIRGHIEILKGKSHSGTISHNRESLKEIHAAICRLQGYVARKNSNY